MTRKHFWKKYLDLGCIKYLKGVWCSFCWWFALRQQVNIFVMKLWVQNLELLNFQLLNIIHFLMIFVRIITTWIALLYGPIFESWISKIKLINLIYEQKNISGYTVSQKFLMLTKIGIVQSRSRTKKNNNIWTTFSINFTM